MGIGLSADALRLKRVTSDAAGSLVALGETNPELGLALSRLVQTVADEAARTPRFAEALGDALMLGAIQAVAPKPVSARGPATARSKGVLDPFSVFEVSGDVGLRARLKTLNVEQLKDIVAEHAMNYDKAALRWKSAPRLVDRIVERVQSRATKGDVLR